MTYSVLFLWATVLQTYKLVICIWLFVWFLTTLLLVDTTDTGFSLVDLNEALEMMYWSGRCRTYGLDLFCTMQAFNFNT